MSNEARNLRIVALAQERVLPAEIASRTGVSVDAIYKVISSARKAGVEIPYFAHVNRGREAAGHSRFGRPLAAIADLARPERCAPRPDARPATAAPIWSADDDDRLRELVGRGVRLTAIAAMMRKPYAMVIAAAERLELFEARELARIAS